MAAFSHYQNNTDVVVVKLVRFFDSDLNYSKVLSRISGFAVR